MRSVFYGTTGTIICDNKSDHINVYHYDEETKKLITEEIGVVVGNHNTKDECRVFADALLSENPMPISSMEGAKTVAVALAAVKSAKENRAVKVEYPNI